MQLNPGWRATLLFTGFAPIFLLELVHIDGAQVTWFFDYRFEHMGNTFEQLSEPMRALLKLRAVPVLQTMIDPILNRCDPVATHADAFLLVNETTRMRIGFHCLDALIHPPASYLVEHLAPHALAFHGDDGRLRTIDRDHLLTGLQEDWPTLVAECVRSGRLTWPSPIDGCRVTSDGGLIFDDFHFAFRFSDPAHRLVFFVVVGEHHAHVAGVWFPSMSILVSLDEPYRGLAHRLVTNLPWWTLTQVLLWSDRLVPYFARGAHRVASIIRGRPGAHIGHQLWNELSGIDQMIRDQPHALPDIIVVNASDGIEMYGSIDRLFPELEGRVNRSLSNIPEMTAWAYDNGLFILRVTRDHVSATLRKRIQDTLLLSPPGRHLADMLRKDRDAPIVLIGLRVENRTIVDLKGFLLRLLQLLTQHYPGLTVVLDGHNSRGEVENGTFIESHGEGGVGESPTEVERALVAALRLDFDGDDIIIVDTIGAPMAASIAACRAADCFVSVWGASLAKYRWVCNTPGFVLSSRTNLLHRPDIHIYNSSRFMDTPTSLLFVDKNAVEDDPTAQQLLQVGGGHPTFYNFNVDESAVFPAILALVKDCFTERRKTP